MDSPLPSVRLVGGGGKGEKRKLCGDLDDDENFNLSFASPGPHFAPEVDSDSKMSSLVSFINRELTSLGLKCLQLEEDISTSTKSCNSSSSHNQQVTKLSLALACVEALNRVGACNKRNEELQLAYKRLCGDNNTQNTQIKRLKSQVESLEREVAKFKESDRQKKKDSSTSLRKLNIEKQNNKKSMAMVQQKVTQLEHSLKRKEKEAQVLREKLDTILGGSKGSKSGSSQSASGSVLGQSQRSNVMSSSLSSSAVQPASIEILNDLKPKRAKWMVAPRCSCDESEKQEFMKSLISNLERKQSVLVSENGELRNLIWKIEAKINDSSEISGLDIERLDSKRGSQESVNSCGIKEEIEDESSKGLGSDSDKALMMLPNELIAERLYNGMMYRIDQLLLLKRNEQRGVYSLQSSMSSSLTELDQQSTAVDIPGSNRSNSKMTLTHYRESLLTDDEDGN